MATSPTYCTHRDIEDVYPNIDNFDSKSAKAFYLRGLILFEQGKKDQACSDLKYAEDNGLLASSNLYDLMCGDSN